MGPTNIGDPGSYGISPLNSKQKITLGGGNSSTNNISDIKNFQAHHMSGNGLRIHINENIGNDQGYSSGEDIDVSNVKYKKQPNNYRPGKMFNKPVYSEINGLYREDLLLEFRSFNKYSDPAKHIITD